MHSGTANAGHYWSYINTKRGHLEDPSSESWPETEKDSWMEFNDSTVREFSFDKIKEDCYGGESSGDSWGFSSSTYGKSAYMLIYERRSKKDLKILCDKEDKGKEGVVWDEKKEEAYKLAKYMQMGDIVPNNIYQ